ncbi:hypothetical protein RB195_005748 [Necator americanus]|uniref:Uncharacterized protein n=1 Tax=Necator americanus TaxID=51031 RepID=A0ABR1BQX1_NECAM
MTRTGWLKHHSALHNRPLGRLVDNRLKEMRKIRGALRLKEVTVEFSYVPTTENPADAGAQGLTKSSRIIHGGQIPQSYVNQLTRGPHQHAPCTKSH